MNRPSLRIHIREEFDSIESIIEEIRRGGMVILTDDADRENEGDLVMAASRVTPAAINFMATHGRGLICVPLESERARQLGLNRMVPDNRESFGTDFTVSVDAARGITTGISAADRARTIRILANPRSKASDLVQPGHIFPLQAKKGGVLRRAGHTEAAVDLARLAGLDPTGVICEILNPDGTMARLPALQEFRRQHGLPLASIQDLIHYRIQHDRLVVREDSRRIETDFGAFVVHVYRSLIDDSRHFALVRGRVMAHRPTLVRVHRQSLLNDLFAPRSDGELCRALRCIEKEGAGVLVYMRPRNHELLEGRRIGSTASSEGASVERSEMDLRDYGIGAQILLDLGVRRFRLLTNHPKKVVGLSGYGLDLEEEIPFSDSPREKMVRKKSS